MLTITIPGVESEQWDEVNECFIYQPVEKEQVLHLEHSLIALSKWESKWHKPFLTDEEMSTEETLDYIQCMTLDKNIDPKVYDRLTVENINEIRNYMDNPMTATTFHDHRKQTGPKGQPTSEIIYYWMITNNIPVEFEKWHIKRLLTLIRVCSIKNSPAKKMSKQEILRRNAALNAERCVKYNTRG